jgi:RNA polymerase-binding protein DksA
MKTRDKPKSLAAATTEALRERLLNARREALADLGVAEDDLRWIEENREIELEERAQDEAASDVLARREEHDFRRIRAIQDALDRIGDGTYGVCASCGEAIAVERLLALPEASLCADCASEAEGNWVRRLAAQSAREEEQTPRALRAELAGLSDSEIVAMVEERFRIEVGTALDDVRVICRHGTVTLVGETASDELRQVALRILEEELGLEGVDRVRVSPSAGERPGATEGSGAGAGPRRSGRTDNVFTTAEEGGDYTPPDRPVAEKE